MKKALPLAAPLLLALTLVPTAAHAAAPVDSDRQARIDLQTQVAEVLEEFPGGEQVGPRTISWDDGAILLELASPLFASRAIGTCPTGRYCAWSGSAFNGSQLSFGGCTSAGWLVSLAPLASSGGARSFANARSTGAIMVLNGSTTVYALSAGGSGVYMSATTGIRCYT